MAQIEAGQVRGGMNHELGALLASRMGRRIDYLAIPRKRLRGLLERGEADLICTYKPEWLGAASLQWSKPFFQQVDVLVTRADARRPRGFGELAGQRIGTVLGFAYPELIQAIGTTFVRDDAPDAEANLRKLSAGRLQHAVVERRLLRHLQRSGAFKAAIHEPLPINSLRTHCALGPRASVTLAQLDQAIVAIERDGSLASLYARYP